MTPGSDEVTAVFIGGSGRCGSTLLDALFGQVDGVFSAGELHHIWSRGFRQNLLCGCEHPFRECELWRRVIDEAYGGIDGIDLPRVLDAQRSLDRIRFIPRLSNPRLRSRSFDRKLREYTDILVQLYGAIRGVTGCAIISDSSKAPSHGFILHQSRAVRLVVVHLVRDSRAVAYSWKKRVVRPEIHWTTGYMPRYSAWDSALRWVVSNSMVERLGRHSGHYLRIRYEQLAEAPAESFSRLLSSIGPALPRPDFIQGDRARIRRTHTVSGNPMRFNTGAIEVRPDLEWKTRMRFVDKILVTVCTWLHLRRYGYGLSWKAGSEA